MTAVLQCGRICPSLHAKSISHDSLGVNITYYMGYVVPQRFLVSISISDGRPCSSSLCRVNGGNGRRVVLTWTAFFIFLAVLSYISGHPVRGPFANILRPHDARAFTLKAGVNCVYPVSRLSDGVDFSHCASFGPPGREPFETWFRRRGGRDRTCG